MKTVVEVIEEIKPIIVDVLAVEEEEVEPSARLFQDLGAESIDMLDMAFRFDKFYGVKMPVQSIVPQGELFTDQSGRLTDQALSTLKEQAPFLDFSEFEKSPTTDRITEMITVEAVARMVISVLERNEIPSAS